MFIVADLVSLISEHVSVTLRMCENNQDSMGLGSSTYYLGTYCIGYRYASRRAYVKVAVSPEGTLLTCTNTMR